MNSPWAIFVLFIVVAVTVLVFGAVAERRRRKELAAFAARIGFQFAPGDAYAGHDLLHGFTPFGQGRARRSSNFMTGERGGVRWEMFDYRYTTGSGKNRRTHHYGVVVARVPLGFTRITLRPEGVFDKVASLAGFDDINFESEAFSRRYHVTGEDRRAVNDLIQPKIMEYLLSLPALHWQLGPGVVLLTRGGSYRPDELGRAMGMIEGFLANVPDYVRAELGAAPGPPPPT